MDSTLLTDGLQPITSNRSKRSIATALYIVMLVIVVILVAHRGAIASQWRCFASFNGLPGCTQNGILRRSSEFEINDVQSLANDPIHFLGEGKVPQRTTKEERDSYEACQEICVVAFLKRESWIVTRLLTSFMKRLQEEMYNNLNSANPYMTENEIVEKCVRSCEEAESIQRHNKEVRARWEIEYEAKHRASLESIFDGFFKDGMED